jgi:hypothetical protein
MLAVHSPNPLANVCVGLSYTYHRDGRALVGKVPNQPNPTLLVRESGGAEGTVTVPPRVPLLQTHTPLRFHLSRPGSPAHSRTSSVSTRTAHHTRNTPSMTVSPTMVSHGMSAIAANQAAQRILTLATESLDMIRGVTGVFKESLDRADA